MPRSNVNAKNRKIRGRFALLPREAMDHPAVATLSHAQFRVLVLMAGQYHGRNNGALGLTAKQAGQQGVGSERTYYSALRELEERGLIERTFPASRIPPRPTMYAITWKSLDDTDYTCRRATPKNTYREWGIQK